MEHKIGEIFEFGGEWYQCVESDSCGECSLFTTECGSGTKSDLADKIFGQCSRVRRSDNKHVIFKKLEKVGKPYLAHDHSRNKDVVVQDYKLYNQHACYNGHEEMLCFGRYGRNDIVTIKSKEPIKSLNCENSVEIQIKQNKEDMEEKGQCGDNRFEIIAKAKEALLKETNIARDEQEMAVIDNILFRCWQMGWLDKYDDTKHSNSENIGKSLKPFNLEAAKAGKPVITRDGRKARIICFDLQSIEKTPIVVAVQVTDKQEVISHYYEDGRQFVDGISELDLMMLPGKKEGWINIYRNEKGEYWSGQMLFSTKKDATDAHDHAQYVTTVKVEWSE